MDETIPRSEPKISTPEVILIGLVFVLFDVIEIVLVFLLLDDFWIIDVISSTIFFYLFMKGVPAMRQLICWVVELVPWLGAFPLLTLGWGLTVWADRHPSSMLAKVGEAAEIARGKGVSYGAPPPGVRGVGAQSLRRIERAEERAREWSARGADMQGVNMRATEKSRGIAQTAFQNAKGESRGSEIDERAFGMPGEPVEELGESLFSQIPGASGVQLDKNAIRLR